MGPAQPLELCPAAAAPGVDGAEGRAFLRGLDWRLTVLILLLAALPMLVAAVPGASDYPNHLARHHVFAAIGRGTALDAYFTVAWRWIGNLGVDLPVLALTPFLGVETATRLVSASIAPLTAFGIILLSYSAHNRVAASAMLALPMAFAQPFLFGFLNYSLAVALALIVAAAWNLSRLQGLWRALGFAAAALLVWTAHIMGWAILLILIGGAELAAVRSARDLLRRSIRAAPLLLPLVPLLVWRSADGGPLYWYSPELLSSKAMNFVTVLKGLWMPLDLAMTVAIGLASIFALMWAGGRKLEPRLAAAGGLLLIGALLLPTTVLGSWGADMRLTPVAVMVALLAIGPAQRPEREKLLFTIGLGLFVLRAGWTGAQWFRAGEVLEARLRLLDEVPRGSRLGFLSVAAECRTAWVLTPDRKIGAYAVVRRDAFTNTLFQIPGSDIMTIRREVGRAYWFDGSQDVSPLCPQGTADLRGARDRMARMARDGFDGIWIAGLEARAVPRLPGFAIAYARGTDALLLKAGPETGTVTGAQPAIGPPASGP